MSSSAFLTSPIAITSAWLDSIDAVYRLFEDPRLRNQYPDLAAKVETGVRLCEQVIAELGLEHCALSFNGGKDCTVIVHILAAVLRRQAGLSKSFGPSPSTPVPTTSARAATTLATTTHEPLIPLPSIYIACPSPFHAVESFIRASQVRYNLDLVTVPGDMKDGLVEYLDGGGEAGVPPLQAREGMCRRRELGGRKKRETKAIFIGTRRTDPGGNTLTPRKWTDPSWPSVERIHLILDWDYKDIWNFLLCPALASCSSDSPSLERGLMQQEKSGQLREKRDERTAAKEEEDEYGTAGGGEQGVPYCGLYEQGYTSLGSTFNTFPNPLLKIHNKHEHEQGFRPAWELEDGTFERAGRGNRSDQ